MFRGKTFAVLAMATMLLAGCASTETETEAKPQSSPFPSTYQPLPGEPTALVGATVLTGTGTRIENATVLFSKGKIDAVGEALAVPAGYTTVNAKGKWITPGIIDAHSHLGVYSSPGVHAHSDGNEATSPNTAEVWAEHSVWPQDEGFNAARRGGVTTLMILPGSANLFGGRTVTLKNIPATTMQAMKFPDAPYGLKMACGENPKRVYGSKGAQPSTRMGNVAGYRAAWIKAAQYAKQLKAAAEGNGTPPDRDLRMETLAGVLNGEILVQNHCYRADEMAIMIDIAVEFGFRITAFHHASEAYKIAPLLAKHDICSATWAGWWGFKLEAYDGIEENAALLEKAGACAVIHSDDPNLTQRLNQETAAAIAASRRLGIPVAEEVAIRWITANPARMLGIADRTGTLEAGKMADVVIWSANPFSVYSKAERVYVDGGLAYDRNDPKLQPTSDFMLGRPRGGN